MKGLILKDLYILKGYGKHYGLIFLFLLLWSISIRSFNFMTMYIVIIGSSLVMSTMSMDEAVSFNRFALAAPLDMRTIVKSKYLLFLITVGGGAGISILLNLLFTGKDSSYEWYGFIAIVTLFLIANGVALPAIFKFGVEKARYVNFLTMILVAAVTAGGFLMADKVGIPEENMEMFFKRGFGIGCLMLGGAALLISYFLSVRIVAKKGL